MNRRSFLGAASLAPALLAPNGAAQTPAKRSRLRTGICAYSFREQLKDKSLSYEDLVRLAVDWDADGLDLTVYWMPDPPPEAWLANLRGLAYRNGVEIYSISVRSELTQPEAGKRDAEVQSLKKWVDVADRLGASHIRVFGGNVPKGYTEDQAAPWVVDCLKRASDYSGTKGVILGLENHGGITLRASRIIEIVDQVKSPWVGINLDTGNFRSEFFPQIAQCLPYAVNVQVKVEMRDEGGQTVPADWDRIVKMLADSGYRGYLALEYEAKPPVMQAMPPLLARLRALTTKYGG